MDKLRAKRKVRPKKMYTGARAPRSGNVVAVVRLFPSQIGTSENPSRIEKRINFAIAAVHGTLASEHVDDDTGRIVRMYRIPVSGMDAWDVAQVAAVLRSRGILELHHEGYGDELARGGNASPFARGTG